MTSAPADLAPATKRLLPASPRSTIGLKLWCASKKLRVLLAATSIAALAACSGTPQREAQWVDPSITPETHLLRGQKVLVACEVYDVTLRLICQDQLLRAVAEQGVTPVPVPSDTLILTNRPIDDQLLGSATAAGARAIFVMSLTPTTTGGGSGVSLGIGGFSFGGSGGAGVGLGVPLGGSAPRTVYVANGRVTDLPGQRLVWSATLSSSPSANLEAHFSVLAREMVDSAQRAGLF